jgi:uncharacterized protein YbjT (DUF2867 family)
MERVMIAGANGTTGKKIVHLLNTSQYFEPVAMVRKEEQIAQFKNIGIEAVLADLEQDISGTLKNIDKVIFAAGSGGKKVAEVDEKGACKMIDDAISNHIKKFVMLSSMGADKPSEAKELKEYLEAKHNADEYLKSSKLMYAIVRPGSLTNEKGTGKINLAESLNTSGFISRDDVAQTLVRTLHDDAPKNTTFEILEGETLIGKALELDA